MPGYTLADGVTLKNKLGAESHETLERLEGGYIAARQLELAAGLGPRGDFDAAHLRALHHHLFQDVFEWAGHTRDEPVRLSDGAVASEPVLRRPGGRPFAAGPEIGGALDALAAKLAAADRFQGLSRDAFAARAAEAMAELNGIHPFREGNGRTQRAFVQQLAVEAGHNLDFAVVSRERMIQASIAAHEQGDLAPMRRMFFEISDPARVAPLRQAIAFFEREGFAWNDRYLATTEPGREVEAVFVGRAGAHFMARTETEILVGEAAHLPRPVPDRGERFTLSAPERQPENERERAGKPRGRGR